jgi:hypothetical protein
MRSTAERLHRLAAIEERMAAPMPHTWPEVVERTWHVGRQSAFREAARIAEQRRAIEQAGKAARR